jgi:YesN/AraC family two-component response regulator
MKIDLIFLIKKYFEAFNVSLLHIAPPFHGLESLDGGIRRFLNPDFKWKELGEAILRRARPDTFLLLEDILGARYALFEIPGEENAVYMIGPWRGAARSEEQKLWAVSALGEQGAALAERYYDSVPRLDNHIIYSITSAFLSQMYPSEVFELVYLYEPYPLSVKIDLRYFTEPDFLHKRSASLLEQRCEAENAVINAVAGGDSRGALTAYGQYRSFDTGSLSACVPRQQKNEIISFNTMLRKAAERANVHPYYTDMLSSKYLTRVENVDSLSAQDRMMHDMILDYCAYVRRYSLRQYSPLIQKVINYVNLHLDTPLSLKKLAELYFISPSYLSSLFRQETGTTLTDYINAQRVQRAAQQLISTNSNISMIAAEVGMLDVNYFSKIFKKTHGMTPTQYRRENQKFSP